MSSATPATGSIEIVEPLDGSDVAVGVLDREVAISLVQHEAERREQRRLRRGIESDR